MFSDFSDDFLEESTDNNTALLDGLKDIQNNVDNYMSVAGHLCGPEMSSGGLDMSKVIAAAFVQDVKSDKRQYDGAYKPRADDSEVMRYFLVY